MASVALDEVSKSYGAAPVVDRVSLEVGDGEFLVLLGPSGCGKTTTLRMIAGLVQPSHGRIRIGGEDVTDAAPRRRNIGMVFQDYALFPNMTVAENIAFGLEERRVGRAATAARVAELVALTRLAGFETRYPGELSGGQQQRVALARAIAYRPRVLLMDEPLGALDLKLREAMQVELHRVQRELGITTIFVTHDQEEAMTLADRIVVMDGGRVEQIGSPEELYGRPATAFVAHFIGRINFLSGEMVGPAGERCAVRLADGAVVTAVARESFAPGAPVRIAIRPECLRLADGDAGDCGNAIEGRMERVRYLGNTTRYFVATASGSELIAERGAALPGIGQGDPVRVAWRAEDAAVFAAGGA